MSSGRALNVAVTGHKFNQLPESERPRLQGEIDRAFECIEAAAKMAAGEVVSCVLYSAIEEGVDRYAADVALSRHWRLVTPLPFSIEHYESTFSNDESRAHFRRLLWASRRVTSVSEDQLAAVAGAGRAAGYAAVGRVLVDKADLLVCVWNGMPPRGPGGTAEVAALMLEKGGLVIWISVGHPEVRLVAPAPLPRAGSFRRKLHEALATRFERVARPPEMRIA